MKDYYGTIGFEKDAHPFISFDNGRYDAKGLRDNMAECLRILDFLSTTTEDEFLYIGSRLRGVYDRAITISDRACIASGLMSSDDMSTLIDGLSGLMERMKAFLKKSESEIRTAAGKLEDIAGKLDSIQLGIDELDIISRNLHILGFSTIMQNAVLTRPDEATLSLGRDVQKLARDVTVRLLAISNDTTVLNEVLWSAISRFSLLETGQQGDAASIVKGTLTGVKTLREKYKSSASVAKEISEYSDGISQSISTVVTSIQFHDITRQQFEHSKAELEKILSRISPLGDRDSRAMLKDDIALREFLAELPDLLAFHFEAILNTRDTFISSMKRAIEGLSITSLTVRDVMKHTGDIIKGGSAAHGSFLMEIEETLSSVMSTVLSLSESARAKKEISDMVRTVTEMTGQISGHITDIEEIEDEVELLSLNASVKADHIGEEGRPLSVIAESMQRVSSETQVYTIAIAAMLESIKETVRELSEEISSKEKAAEAPIKEMSSSLRGIVDSIGRLNREVISSLSEIEKSGTELTTEIQKIVSKTVICNTVERLTDDILMRINEMSSEAKKIAPMARGRSADRKRLSLMREDLEKEIRRCSAISEEVKSGMPGELGDNVELF